MIRTSGVALRDEGPGARSRGGATLNSIDRWVGPRAAQRTEAAHAPAPSRGIGQRVDPYRYVSFVTRKVMQAWADRERPPDRVAWRPLAKPLDECRVARLATAGIALRTDRPFDQERERADPWWGDPSWRAIPADATEDDVRLYHLHVDPEPAARDLDVELPLRRLGELVDAGVVGDRSPRHFSIMGYILDATELVAVTAPELAAAMRDDQVDLALLVPS